MLSAMGFLRSYIDRRAQSLSLNVAISYAVTGPFECGIGLFWLLMYFQRHDNFWLFMGSAFLPLGWVSTAQGILLIHAFVRRARSESRVSACVEISASGSQAPEAGLN